MGKYVVHHHMGEYVEHHIHLHRVGHHTNTTRVVRPVRCANIVVGQASASLFACVATEPSEVEALVASSAWGIGGALLDRVLQYASGFLVLLQASENASLENEVARGMWPALQATLDMTERATKRWSWGVKCDLSMVIVFMVPRSNTLLVAFKKPCDFCWTILVVKRECEIVDTFMTLGRGVLVGLR